MELLLFLEKFTANVSSILKENLVGIYLHGSASMGCYREGTSDIDILIIVSNPLSLVVKRKLITVVLELEEKDPQKQTEWSILLKADLDHFSYPTPFVLHYSKIHKEQYILDPSYSCANDVDPDLAAHIVMTRKRGKCLAGGEICQVFPSVPDEYYIRSIVHDVKDAVKEMDNNPVYYILNLCRVLCYLRNRSVLSKKGSRRLGVTATVFIG
ncbi:DUF4111 domain-containing protein [Virgibacillus halophilus]|uniref:DUF4111 domain-containing protein n=1 Tax=Tigheibacillus halophilus TaxID=361280 RepID=A0ABU5CC65_9BACI|nr:DUF4111 domain-containing protein [Virgibacillus halophilus]